MVKEYNTKDLANLMNVNQETVRRWHRKGSVYARQIGKKGHLVFLVDEDTKEIKTPPGLEG